MLLNDNDCDNIDAVYAIARFFFEKKAVTGKPYKFSMPHIFEKDNKEIYRVWDIWEKK